MVRKYCEICQLLPVKFKVKNKDSRILWICQLCFGDFELEGVQLEILKTFQVSKIENEGRGNI